MVFVVITEISGGCDFNAVKCLVEEKERTLKLLEGVINSTE